MPTIYESPDKGKTVYAREFGENFRTLIQSKESCEQTRPDEQVKNDSLQKD